MENANGGTTWNLPYTDFADVKVSSEDSEPDNTLEVHSSAPGDELYREL